MTDNRITEALVLTNEQVATDIFKMNLYAKECFKDAKAGQFVNLYTGDPSMLLPRPISICDSEKDTLTLVFRVAGKGTNLFSHLKTGDHVKVSTPLGNGYNLETLKLNEIALLVGGGVGIPPMVKLARELWDKSCNVIAVLGFKDEPFLVEEFIKWDANVYICTDSGSAGFKGNVVELLRQKNIRANASFACGPKIMLKNLNEYSKEKNMPLFVSLEERMGCGFGACVGCAVDIKDENGEISKKKVCKDGPVFKASEVVW